MESLTRSMWIVALLLVGAAGAAEPPRQDVWRRVDTPNFSLFGNVSPEQLVETGIQIETLREVLRGTTGGLSTVPTTIYVFRGVEPRASYGTVLKRDRAGLNGNVDGPTHAVNVAKDATGKTTLGAVIRHDYVHTVLDDNIPDAPLCIDEGLALFYDTVFAPPGQATAAVGTPPRERLAELKRATLLPVDRLLAANFQSPEYDGDRARESFHAQCWLLAHWLIVPDEERRGRFVDFVGRLRRGEPPLEAFRTATAMAPETLDQELGIYARSESFASLLIELDTATIERVNTATPISKAETLYRQGDLLSQSEILPSESTKQLLRAALKLEPDRLDIQLDLARLNESADGWPTAASLYEAALEDGGNAARIRYGRMLLERASISTRDMNKIPKDVARARELFREVLATDPDNLAALAEFARTFKYGESDRAEAIAALNRARSLMPSKIDFLADLVGHLATTGRLDEAAALYADLQARTTDFDPRNTAEWGIYAGVTRYSEALRESGDEAGALASLRKAFEMLHIPWLSSMTAQRLANYDALASERPHLARYKQAYDALERKDTHEALALYERVASESEDAAIQKAAREMARDIRPAVVHDRVAAGRRKALDLAAAGDAAGAARTLEALVADNPDLVEADRARIAADLAGLREESPAAPAATPVARLKRDGNKILRTADEMELVTIPAGSFKMGSERREDDGQPIHRVHISRAFLMDRHEVTIAQYGRVMAGVPEGQTGGPDTPVVHVRWSDAQEYCGRVGGRLPTEAEWEYAARGGLAGKTYSWGDEEVCAGGTCRANVCDRNCGHLYGKKWSWDDGFGETAPVCRFGANGYGLCDTTGNVSEWVADWYEGYSRGEATDPSGPATGQDRVTRGGSWVNLGTWLSVANRYPRLPGERFGSLGFRCAVDITPPEAPQ
ncbi:MAG TPA: SUMF1/EgtB/PvdO family nonheme iron enzyme [Candidatus Polarisedimenticolaceae bacterium]